MFCQFSDELCPVWFSSSSCHFCYSFTSQGFTCHEDCVEKNEDPTETAFNFHKAVVNGSNNKAIIATTNLLFNEEIKIEEKIHDLSTRAKGDIFCPEHEDIYKAIENRDSEKAAELMRVHIKDLINTIRAQYNEIKKVFEK